MRRRLTPAMIAIAVTLAASACGGSSPSSKGVIARAAADTARVPGYRLAGTVTISSAAPPTTTQMGLAGTFNRTSSRARIATVGLVNGHQFQVSELVSGLSVYMGASALPGGARLTGGKPWLKLDLSRSTGAAGTSSLPTASDPTQFVDYLRAVSSATSSKGLDVIRGVESAHYHAIVDLDRYPALVSAATRPAILRSVKALETTLGSHTLPVDVWVDVHGLVRRIRVGFQQCVGRTRFTFGMTLDLYDYGVQPNPHVPSPHAVYNLTPLISKALRHAKLGCTR